MEPQAKKKRATTTSTNQAKKRTKGEMKKIASHLASPVKSANVVDVAKRDVAGKLPC